MLVTLWLMMFQVWNDALASMAVKWAAGCAFVHGQPKLDTDPPFAVIGQNLYVVSSSRKINLTSGIQLWYDEKADYTYDTLQCAEGKPCGHYTQVLTRIRNNLKEVHVICFAP